MNDNIYPMLVRPDPAADATAGNQGRFDRFLHQQRQALVTFLRKRLAAEEDAQDAAQESMVRLLRYRDASPPEDWRPLLYRIAVNVAHDQARHGATRRANAHVPYEEALQAEASQEPSQEEWLSRQRAMGRLWQIIRQLPEHTQEIYVLNRIEGMTFEEVARHCGLSTSTVEKHVARAVLAVRIGLGEIGRGAL